MTVNEDIEAVFTNCKVFQGSQIIAIIYLEHGGYVRIIA